MKEVNVFVSGCTGNFGRRIVDLVNQHPNLKVCGGFGRKENQYDFPVFDADDFKKTYDFFKKQKPGLIIDVSNPTIAGTIYYYIASDFKIPLVVGTTKLDKSLILHMKSETDIPVFQAYNFLTSMKDFTKRVCDVAVNSVPYFASVFSSIIFKFIYITISKIHHFISPFLYIFYKSNHIVLLIYLHLQMHYSLNLAIHLLNNLNR